MKKINQLMTALAGIFRSKSITTQSSPAPQGNPQKTETDEIEFCCHPRHGAFPPRRKFKATGVSARGHEFAVFQCPVPGCGEFVARTKDQTTGDYRILFRGHHFNPHRESPPRPAFRPVRAAHHAA